MMNVTVDERPENSYVGSLIYYKGTASVPAIGATNDFMDAAYI